MLKKIITSIFVSLLLLNCGPKELGPEPPTCQAQNAITAPVGMSLKPWTVAVSHPSGQCSGTLIAPDTVLTAGHCILDHTPNDYTITAYNVNETRSSVGSWTKYWISPGADRKYINHKAVDIGLIYLDKPINIDNYPRLGMEPLNISMYDYNIQVIGRKNNNELTLESWISRSEKIDDQYGNHYICDLITSQGDSGGAVILADTDLIVGVHVAGNSTQGIITPLYVIGNDIKEILREKGKLNCN